MSGSGIFVSQILKDLVCSRPLDYGCLECAKRHQKIWIKKRGGTFCPAILAKTNDVLKLLKAALEKTPTKSLTVGNLVENIMKPVVKETLDSYKSLDCSK